MLHTEQKFLRWEICTEKKIIWYIHSRIFLTKIRILKEKKNLRLKQVSTFSKLRTQKYFLWVSSNSSFRKQSTFLYSHTLYVCIQVVRHVYGTHRHIFQKQIEHQFRLLLTNDCYINFCCTSYSLWPWVPNIFSLKEVTIS